MAKVISTVVVGIKCRKCKEEHIYEITVDQLNKLKEGKELAQNILGDLDPDERELFISGICSTCWDKIFSQSEIMM